jgi:hypothetical protein
MPSWLPNKFEIEFLWVVVFRLHFFLVGAGGEKYVPPDRPTHTHTPSILEQL